MTPAPWWRHSGICTVELEEGVTVLGDWAAVVGKQSQKCASQGHGLRVVVGAVGYVWRGAAGSGCPPRRPPGPCPSWAVCESLPAPACSWPPPPRPTAPNAHFLAGVGQDYCIFLDPSRGHCCVQNGVVRLPVNVSDIYFVPPPSPVLSLGQDNRKLHCRGQMGVGGSSPVPLQVV